VLRTIVGHKMDEVTGCLRKLHRSELHYLYSPPNVIRMIKSKSVRWTEYVAGMDEKAI
jgi:hypothetical protein